MSVKVFIQRIEISFWQTFIRTLSESTMLRNLLPEIYDLICKSRPLLLLIAWACLGLSIGFGLGALRGIFW